MKASKPLNNVSREAVRLRKAAIAFAEHDPYAGDLADSKGQRLNRMLLRAALLYARICRPPKVTTVTVECPECDGSGACSACNGEASIHAKGCKGGEDCDGDCPGWHECRACDESGECDTCRGQGSFTGKLREQVVSQ